MIRVWTDKRSAGVLDRLAGRGSTFAYEPTAGPERAVSVTLPVRVQSWDSRFALLPIFEMNLPEGALRERLRRRFAKATGTFDDLDLLGVVGRTQIGRIRYSAMDATIDEHVPFQSIDEILRARRGGELFEQLLETFVTHSGLSGVQPKIMVRGLHSKPSQTDASQSITVSNATHIVKLWEADEFSELAANEYFCLTAARRLGLQVPQFTLSDDGGALVIERFDLLDEGYLGFEDFCVLNAFGTADKYKGSYETRLFKRTAEFVLPPDISDALEDLFRLFLLNCAIRNGDAHLKNFGITYHDVNGAARLAPVYDLVTTWAYLPNDPMALTLDGSTSWPDRKALVRLGQIRAGLGLKAIERHMEATCDALADTRPDLRRYFSGPVAEIGDRIISAWEAGVRNSLGVDHSLVSGAKSTKPKKASTRKARSSSKPVQ